MADTLGGAGQPPPLLVPCPVDKTGLSWPACEDGMVKRGYYVYVKPNYDPNKPSKVIYHATGCQSSDNGATGSYDYKAVDGASATQVIEVGLTYSRNNKCYDATNPLSTDFAFLPLLQQKIEDQFCVDKKRSYFSGYSSGSFVGSQFSCAFPERFSAMVFATGEEPAMQPACKTAGPAVAALFLHDIADIYNTAI